MTDPDPDTGEHALPRDSDPTLVDDERHWWHKAEYWYFLFPSLLVAIVISGILVASGEANLFIEVAWYVLIAITVLLIPFWSWYLEPTPADAGHGSSEAGEAPHADKQQETGSREA